MRLKKIFLLLALLAGASFLWSSCSKSTSNKDDPIVSVSADDQEMNNAIDQARKSAQQFIVALQSPAKSQSDFFVKKRFVQGDSNEHIWLSNVTFDGENFHGKVGNDPEIVNNIKFGDDAVVSKNEISDWMYVQDGKLVGGYTFRVLYLRMTPVEKSNFLQQVPFKLE